MVPFLYRSGHSLLALMYRVSGFAVDRGVESVICNFNIYVEKVEFIVGGTFYSYIGHN